MISTVVFDLGGVLIDWDPGYILDADDVVALDIDGVQRALDRGTPVEDVRALWLRDHAGHEVKLNLYFDDWHRTVAGPVDDVVAILDELRADPVTLYALSNFSGDLFRRVRHRFAFLEWFDGLLISGDEGVVKPDPRIYRLLIDRYRLEPGATVFVDDLQDNVAAAREAGLVGIRFDTAAQLRRELMDLGLLGGAAK